jgi:hypothetical protein
VGAPDPCFGFFVAIPEGHHRAFPELFFTGACADFCDTLPVVVFGACATTSCDKKRQTQQQDPPLKVPHTRLHQVSPLLIDAQNTIVISLSLTKILF